MGKINTAKIPNQQNTKFGPHLHDRKKPCSLVRTSKQTEHANNSRGHSKQSLALKSIKIGGDVFQSSVMWSSFGA